MTLALAYGFFVSCPDGFHVDTSDPEVMKQFLGKDTSPLYLSEDTIEKLSWLKDDLKRVVFVTTYSRSRHDFEHFMVATDSLIDGYKLRKNIRQPALPDRVIVDQLGEFITKVNAAIGGESCPVAENDPRWHVLTSDD